MRFLDRFRSRRGITFTVSTAARPAEEQWVRRPSPFVVDPTWLQTPTFRSAGWLVDVVGESFYQDAIDEVSGGRTETGAAMPLVTAQLVLEPENPYDADAVRIDIGGHPCGHIPRADALDYHATLTALAEIGRPATCRARITGGWQRGVLDKGHFGICLDVHPDLETGERVAVLPFGEGRVSITGEQNAQAHLETLLDGTDRVEILATLGQPAERIGVWIHGELVGTLTPKMSERYGPWVTEVQAAMLPASCEARIVRGPKKIEVFLKLAMPWKATR